MPDARLLLGPPLRKGRFYLALHSCELRALILYHRRMFIHLIAPTPPCEGKVDM